MQHTSNSKILILDDDNASRLLMAAILADANVINMECGSSSEAIALFKQYFETIVLVVLDIQVRGCEDGKLLRLFRQLKPCIRVVAVAAMAPAELVYACKPLGYHDYLAKPFDIDDFLIAVSFTHTRVYES
jgi:DNA-binding NtrC family response regulator